MKLSIAIVGLPNVGKSTLFKLLTKQEVNIANYPFATIDPNVGVVPVPDERLDKLAKLSKSKKIVPAVVEFYDIAGLVKGANKGEGLGNQFLSHIRDTQAIVIVLRVFRDPEIVHVENSVDPLRDLEIINTELILKDLDTVEKRLSKVEGEARTGAKDKIALFQDLKIVQVHLAAGKPLITLVNQAKHSNGFDKLTTGILQNTGISEMNLLTAKKQLHLLNGEEKDVPADLVSRIKELNSDHLVMNLAEAADLKHTNKLEFVGMSTLIKKSYEVLDLISFLTTGEDETRAWTIKRGTLAPQAAGVIHTDFETRFIRAEVINWEKLLAARGWSEAKQKGWVRLEGKEYVVQDGDVMVIRHG